MMPGQDWETCFLVAHPWKHKARVGSRSQLGYRWDLFGCVAMVLLVFASVAFGTAVGRRKSILFL